MVHPTEHDTFRAGSGPKHDEETYFLLDAREADAQSNAFAWERSLEGTFQEWSLRCSLLVIVGADGGGFAFLDTSRFGARGPAPFLADWAEPSLAESFAVGVDVHNPATEDPFGPDGNYLGRPEREISLHWDGREIVNRLVKNEFRGNFVEFEVRARFVAGGAKISVRVGQEWVYDSYFLPDIQPYETRLAIGASSSMGKAGAFTLKRIHWNQSQPASESRRPAHFPIFNFVKSNAPPSARRQRLFLPPLHWAYARIVLTLEIHDAGLDWDGWDRNGFFNVIRPDGSRYDIAPFVTSFRKPGRWQMDVTHFRPWLAGEVTFEIATTTLSDSKRYYLLSAALDFYHGQPDLLPYRIESLWYGTAKYGSDDQPFGDFFVPKKVNIDPAAKEVRLFMTATGHSPVGEFTPAERILTLTNLDGRRADKSTQFKNTLWKEDVYLNPVRPQAGTWKYARAGWAPGSIVEPWIIDFTPFIAPGSEIRLDYEPQPYDFSNLPTNRRPSTSEIGKAILQVRSCVVFYQSPGVLTPAPYLQLVEVAADSNASRSGVKAGDFLVRYNNIQPKTIDELRQLIREAEHSDDVSIPIEIFRDNEKIRLHLEPGRMGVQLFEQ